VPVRPLAPSLADCVPLHSVFKPNRLAEMAGAGHQVGVVVCWLRLGTGTVVSVHVLWIVRIDVCAQLQLPSPLSPRPSVRARGQTPRPPPR